MADQRIIFPKEKRSKRIVNSDAESIIHQKMAENYLRKYPVKLFWRLYFIVLGVSLILDFYWLYTHAFHFHFSFQSIPQFFALFGLIGCMLLILIAKGMGKFIVVDEDYYQKRSGEIPGDAS